MFLQCFSFCVCLLSELERGKFNTVVNLMQRSLSCSHRVRQRLLDHDELTQTSEKENKTRRRMRRRRRSKHFIRATIVTVSLTRYKNYSLYSDTQWWSLFKQVVGYFISRAISPRVDNLTLITCYYRGNNFKSPLHNKQRND